MNEEQLHEETYQAIKKAMELNGIPSDHAQKLAQKYAKYIEQEAISYKETTP